jgi:hypothetical protein
MGLGRGPPPYIVVLYDDEQQTIQASLPIIEDFGINFKM